MTHILLFIASALLILPGSEIVAQAVLPDGVVLIRGAFVPGRQPDGNSLLLAAPDGWIVVDSGRHAAHTQRIADAVRGSGRPLAAIVNTHWHLDHVSGNPALRAAWPRLEVHGSDAIDAALQGFLARYRGQLQQLRAKTADAGEQARLDAEIARIDAGPALRPDQVVSAADERTIAGRRLRIGLARHAATAGDVWLFDPATRVLVAGDLVTLPAPFLDTACAPRWQAELATLATLPFEHLVPGHGAPLDRAAYQRYRQAFDRLLDCAGSDNPAPLCAARWLGDAESLLDGEDPDFVRDLIEYYVSRRLRGAAAAADCPA